MKDHKFQLIRIGVGASGASVRYTGETDKTALPHKDVIDRLRTRT